MEKLKILIVDDEKRIRTSLRNVIKLHYEKAEVIGEAENVHSAAIAIKSLKPDVVLLDIRMPDESGFDLLKQLMPLTFKVIFITAYSQYAIQAFKFSAMDYLLKPVIPEELVNALNRTEQQLQNESYQSRLNVFLENISNFTSEHKKIVLNSHDKIHVITASDIIRCQADGNYTKFFILNGKPVLASKPLKDYDEILVDFGFFRPHHSHLVNTRFIDRLEKHDGGVLIMKDGSQVPVSSRKYSDLMIVLNKL